MHCRQFRQYNKNNWISENNNQLFEIRQICLHCSKQIKLTKNGQKYIQVSILNKCIKKLKTCVPFT